MKSFVILFSLTSFSVSAVEVIAMARTVDVFSRMPCHSKEVKVYSNGLVERTRCDQEATEIATLSQDSVDKMVAFSASLKSAQLIAERPGPSCMDAPATTFSVMNDQAELVDIGGVWGCKRVIYPGGNYRAAQLRSILEGINDLSQL